MVGGSKGLKDEWEGMDSWEHVSHLTLPHQFFQMGLQDRRLVEIFLQREKELVIPSSFKPLSVGRGTLALSIKILMMKER